MADKQSHIHVQLFPYASPLLKVHATVPFASKSLFWNFWTKVNAEHLLGWLFPED